MGNLGNYFGFIPGAIGDLFGPRIAIFVSLFLMAGGYFLLYCAAANWYVWYFITIIIVIYV